MHSTLERALIIFSPSYHELGMLTLLHRFVCGGGGQNLYVQHCAVCIIGEGRGDGVRPDEGSVFPLGSSEEGWTRAFQGDKTQHRFHVRTVALQPGCTCHLQNFENPRPHPTPVKPEPLGVLPGSNVFQTPQGTALCSHICKSWCLSLRLRPLVTSWQSFHSPFS